MDLARLLTDTASRSLLYEVSVTPKLGLVDPLDHLTHADMDVFTFIDSTLSLTDYWQACLNVASGDITPKAMFQRIRPLGIQAEQSMLTVTHGVNTHKGAIFSLGVLVTATAAILQTRQPSLSAVQDYIQKMLQGLVSHDFAHVREKPSRQLTAGERQYVQLGLTGIRGEAEAGYPVVFDIALPYLHQVSGSLNQRFLATLLMIARHSKDSNLIKRAGDVAILDEIYPKIDLILSDKGLVAHWSEYLDLKKEFDKKKLSLGGSADLLILTIFLYLLEEQHVF